MKKTLIVVFSLFLCLSVFYACQKKDYAEEFNKPGQALNTELAHAYFYSTLGKNGANVVKNSGDKNSSDTRKNYKIPMFKKAYTSSTDQYSFVEVPLFYNQRTAILLKSRDSSKMSTNDHKILMSSFDRLIIFKDKKTGEINQRIVTYLPDADYVNKHSDLSGNQIDKLSKKFNGHLIYKTWEDEVLFILKIKNGKSVRRIAKQSKKAKTSKVSGYEVCRPIYVSFYIQRCYGTEYNGVPTNEHCYDWILGGQEYSHDECTYYDDYGYEYSDEDNYQPGEPTCFFNGTCNDVGGGNSGGGTSPTDPCTNSTTYSKSGARVMTGCDVPIDQIADKYPCAKAVLAEIPTLKSDIADLINKTFNANTNNRIVFKDGEPSKFTDSLDGITNTDATGISSVIELNPKMLLNATNEYILATMYHEALHATLRIEQRRLGFDNFKLTYPAVNICYDRDDPGNLDKTTYKIFEDSQYKPLADGASHRTMAQYYTDCLTSSIIKYNPNIPEATARIMARSGIIQLTYEESLINNAEKTGSSTAAGAKCPN